MKLLIIIDSLGSGGAETSTEVICDYLTEKQEAFEIVCLDKKKVGVQDRVLEKGYPVHFIKKGNFLKEVIQISRIIKQGNYDVVHSILFRSNLRTRLAKLLVKFKHIESLVNTTYSEERFNDPKVGKLSLKLYFWLDKLTSRLFVDHFHSITATVKNHYIQKLGINKNIITVIFRGRKPLFESKEFKEYTQARPLKLLNVGRHEFQKGQIYLLEAVKALKERGNKVELTVLGRDGGETQRMKDFIKNSHLENEVLLLGYTSNVPKYLSEADIFVFPSLYEGLGGALIEAQAAALPIICNDIPVFSEVVNADENAKLVNSYDTGKVVEAIEFFIFKPENIEKFGKNSLQNYNEKYRLDDNNEKMYQLYQSLC